MFRIPPEKTAFGFAFGPGPGLQNFSPYGSFQRFAAGIWTVAELSFILRFAWMGAGDVTRNVFVDTVLTREPPGNYAPLAARVLEAYLLGIDPRLAVFDERDPFKVVELAA